MSDDVITSWLVEVCNFLHVDLWILALFFLVALPLPMLWALRRLWCTLARLHALDDPEGDAYRKEIERGRMKRFGCSRHHPANTHARGR